MSEIPKKVAIGFTVSIVVAVLGVFLKQPVVDSIVDGLRWLPRFLSPAGDWVDAHQIVFKLATTVAGAALAFSIAKRLRVWDGLGAILLGGGLLGFLASGSVLEWMAGAVLDGPVVLAGVAVLTAIWLIAAIRSAARWKRFEGNTQKARTFMPDGPSRYRLPSVPIEPRDQAANDRLSASRAASYSASLLRHSHLLPDERRRRETD